MRLPWYKEGREKMISTHSGGKMPIILTKKMLLPIKNLTGSQTSPFRQGRA